MKTTTGGAVTFRFPMRLLLTPGVTLAAGVSTMGLPPSSISFIGWGGILGPEQWPDDPKELSVAMRAVLLGVSKTAALKGATRVVIGCENRTRWLRENPKRWEAIDAMLRGIFWGMLMVHGAHVPVGFSGPEDVVCGDFRSPMLGARTSWNPEWDERDVIPFIAPRYGASVEQAAAIIARLASGPGVREIVVWVQEDDAESQRKGIEFAVAVDQAAGRMM